MKISNVIIGVILTILAVMYLGGIVGTEFINEFWK